MLLGISKRKNFYDFNRQLNPFRNDFYDFFRLKYECCGCGRYNSKHFSKYLRCGAQAGGSLSQPLVTAIPEPPSNHFTSTVTLTGSQQLCNFALKDVEMGS